MTNLTFKYKARLELFLYMYGDMPVFEYLKGEKNEKKRF